MGLAGCGGTSPAAQQPPSGLANVDPCKIMNSQQLSADGFGTQSKPVKHFDVEPGCSFDSDKETVSFFKNQTKTVDTYGQQSNWAQYNKTSIAGRPAAIALSKDDVGNGVCSALVSAGGGVVIVDTQSGDPRKPYDACGQAQKYAQEVASSLPQ
jgi:hypothetical protein